MSPRGFLEDQADDRDLGELDARAFEVTGTIVEKERDRLLFDSGIKKVWVPHSKILGTTQSAPKVVTLQLPEWWAKKVGLLF
jgi:hypothetical protein